jgi:hypothetical protein
VDAVHSLAGALNEAAKAGRVDEASALEARLADAQLALAAGKAEALIARGAYSSAVKALEEAPADIATDAAVATYVAPLRRRLASLRQLASDLLAAEKALEAYNVDAAQQKLTAAASSSADSELLAMKLEVLGEVIDQIRAEQDKHIALTVRRDERLESVRNMLAVARAREGAWDSFIAALTSFLKGEETGVAAIQAVAADTADLPAAAASLATDVGRELADWASRPAADEARRVLTAAKASYAAADYVAAAALLKQLRGMQGAADPVVAAEADALAGRIAGVEADAAALYAKAIEAYGRDDAESVRNLLTELKSKYANTQAYLEHM